MARDDFNVICSERLKVYIGVILQPYCSIRQRWTIKKQKGDSSNNCN